MPDQPRCAACMDRKQTTAEMENILWLTFLVLQLLVVYSLDVTFTPPLLDVPTFSLATLGPNGKTNMNILTYATPVSIRPDRVWSMGLFKDTLSYENFSRQRSGVLQLLREPHAKLVKLLGGSSGKDVDKMEECSKIGFPWIPLETNQDMGEVPLVLPQCACYLRLTLQGELIDCGSHDVALCRVESMLIDPQLEQEKEGYYLSTVALRRMGIITEQGRVA